MMYANLPVASQTPDNLSKLLNLAKTGDPNLSKYNELTGKVDRNLAVSKESRAIRAATTKDPVLKYGQVSDIAKGYMTRSDNLTDIYSNVNETDDNFFDVETNQQVAQKALEELRPMNAILKRLRRDAGRSKDPSALAEVLALEDNFYANVSRYILHSFAANKKEGILAKLIPGWGTDINPFTAGGIGTSVLDYFVPITNEDGKVSGFNVVNPTTGAQDSGSVSISDFKEALGAKYADPIIQALVDERNKRANQAQE